MKTLFLWLGPPCGGKSTAALQTGIARFSVRHWFEPKRNALLLPTQGVFLDNAAVFQAVLDFCREHAAESQLLFDGFPANAEQFSWVLQTFGADWEIHIRYFTVSYAEALKRSLSRRVCFHCDGGADPVVPCPDGTCPCCGSKVGMRPDDTEAQFAERWQNYLRRAKSIFDFPAAAHYRTAVTNARTALLNENLHTDLHLHTTASDGVDTPAEMMRKAYDAGIRFCAVTDHDTDDGIEEAAAYAAKYGIGFLAGAELSAVYQDTVIHLLVYGTASDIHSLQGLMKENLYRRKQYDNRIIARFIDRKLLPADACSEYAAYRYDKKRGGWKLLNYLIDKNICADGFDYNALLAAEHVGQPDYLPAQYVVKIAGEAGTVVFAHPGAYHWGADAIEPVLYDLLKIGIQGIECRHPLHSAQITETALCFCRKHALVITGGSDDHGNLPDRKIGTPFTGSCILLNSNLNRYIQWNL